MFVIKLHHVNMKLKFKKKIKIGIRDATVIHAKGHGEECSIILHNHAISHNSNFVC